MSKRFHPGNPRPGCRRAWIPELTDTQRAIAESLARGMVRKTIAGELAMDTHTVRYHVQEIQRKTGLRSDIEIAVWWYSITRGIVKPWTQVERAMMQAISGIEAVAA